jgi:hypothetical protein
MIANAATVAETGSGTVETATTAGSAPSAGVPAARAASLFEAERFPNSDSWIGR